ncbi:SseB family protein [Luteipulveratus flavus]|uniref:SseB family protein n=1 Tax=Luteipulveratus flavus TaxID=3031728 RepID=A0ABT6C3Z4_9MICO|nr:SseB family protein [Luteipulveratus sp. YIM 133296]MDF8263455.1 SseB family protein [Luteipulveratus sp. YIM 133296]
MTDGSDSTDSAGQEWHGRSLSGTGFDDDTGSADAGLVAALADPGDELRLMRAVAEARLLVPVVAAPTEIDDSGDLAVEKSTDMAVVTLTAPDGQRALPVFSGVEALARWDEGARPSPVTSARAAQAAVSERCDVIVLDVGSPHQVVLRPSMVWALAQQRAWIPAHQDEHVRSAVAAAVRDDPAVEEVRCEDGSDAGPGVLRVVLGVRPGLSQNELREVATRVGERIATDGEVRARIDGLAFALQAAGPADPGGR